MLSGRASYDFMHCTVPVQYESTAVSESHLQEATPMLEVSARSTTVECIHRTTVR